MLRLLYLFIWSRIIDFEDTYNESWTERTANTKVLRRANIQNVLTNIKYRNIRYLKHVLRREEYCLFHLLLKGKIDDQCGIGRMKMSWLKNIRELTGIQAQNNCLDLQMIETHLPNVTETEHGT